MGLRADAFDERNAALFSLRDLDEQLRQHYPVNIQNRATAHALQHERDVICENIREMSAEPWEFSEDGDNSWLK